MGNYIILFNFYLHKGHSTTNEGSEGNVSKHPAMSPVVGTQYYFSCLVAQTACTYCTLHLIQILSRLLS